MAINDRQQTVKFTVKPDSSGRFAVCQSGFDAPISQFYDMDSAEGYALRMAETNARWIVETYDASDALVGTYNSDEDAMPKPLID